MTWMAFTGWRSMAPVGCCSMILISGILKLLLTSTVLMCKSVVFISRIPRQTPSFTAILSSLSPNPHRINSFADPHLLNSVESYLCKNHRGRVAPCSVHHPGWGAPIKLPAAHPRYPHPPPPTSGSAPAKRSPAPRSSCARSEQHTAELQAQSNLVCRLLLAKTQARRHQL